MALVITNIYLPHIDKEQAAKLWTVECHGHRVAKVTRFGQSTGTSPHADVEDHFVTVDGNGGLLLPSFCHSHIHLDKCFVLDQCGDLVKGDFAEAMLLTKKAKTQFSNRADDLYARGARVIRESLENGVTAMRAHVEVDTSVGFACLEAAQKLQSEYNARCDVQIAVFAQEPLFASSEDTVPGSNFSLLKEAASRSGISVIGSAPYVEPTIGQAKANIGLIFDIADTHNLNHVDFHLDYNLDPNSEPLIYEVITQLKERYERGSSTGKGIPSCDSIDSTAEQLTTRRSCPRITIGHATRLQLFSPAQWNDLAESIQDLPITFVGLPQSDMYMQGRAFVDDPLGAPRGTLRVPHIARNYGIQIAISVNNVENAFTPQGSLDPLSLCAFGVAVFQAATPDDIRSLARSVTSTSKQVLGLKPMSHDLVPGVGDQADFVVLHGRKTLQSALLNPPYDRTTIKGGRVVARRVGMTWLLG
ncbi:hypothetical protein B0H34DRAFT_708561 [Crassisporium funariophilum]|nr:hypothetical protein B0H34DRAFT_708561 [Crassisporium funariophilum]